MIRNDTSFATAVKGGGTTGEVMTHKQPLVLHPCMETLVLLKGSFVGYLKHQGGGESVQNSMRMEGTDKIQVTTMGGQMVLLQSEQQGEICRAAEFHKFWWDSHFREMKEWNPSLVASKITVWIKILSLPVHVWDEEAFKQIGDQFGEFLDFDEDTILRRILDVARIKIYTIGWIIGKSKRWLRRCGIHNI